MNKIISETTTGNYMKTSQHCSYCHQDYLNDNHTCRNTTGNPFCQRCDFAKSAKEAVDKMNDKKYCPYCGHKL